MKSQDLRLEIEYLPVDSLRPYDRNARKHADDDVDAIAASIKTFGFDDPIGIWRDNLIVEGHGRLLAAKKLGMTEVPCIRLDHLTDEERRAYALAHNRTAELSAWDMELVNFELTDLEAMNFDISLTGFEMNEDASEKPERDGVAFHDTLSVIVECGTEEEAEEIYNELTERGLKCRISTL